MSRDARSISSGPLPALQARYRDRFALLRQLRVTGYRQASTAPSATAELPGQVGPVDARIRYCLITPVCDLDAPTDVSEITEAMTFATRDGKMWITGLAPPRPAASVLFGVPPPWQAGHLVVRTGTRAIVAAPPALAAHLDAVRAAADRAAPVVDRYAQPVQPPAHYLIYLAGPTEWNTWFGGPPPGSTTIGYAHAANRLHRDIVLNTAALTTTIVNLDVVIQHEMGHVATLTGADRRYGPPTTDHDWLKEGLAEYIAWTGRDPHTYYRLDNVRRHLRGKRWNGQPPTPMPASDPAAISAAYGISYLIVGYLATRYGEAAMLTFANLLLRNHKTYDSAARTTFDVTWATLVTDSATHIHTTTR